MDKLPITPVINNSKSSFLRGLAAIIMVGILMTFFELMLYYFAVRPNFKNGINSFLNSINFNFSVPPIVTNISNGLSNTAEEDGNYINILKFCLIMLEIIVLIIIFIIIIWTIKRWNSSDIKKVVQTYNTNTNITQEIINKHKKEEIAVGINILLVAIPLITSQIFLYFFAQVYEYGSEEGIELRFINSILKYQEREDEIIDLPSGTRLI